MNDVRPALPGMLAAADKMHNLYFVTILECCRGPGCAPYYLPIDLNGQPFRLEPKLVYQIDDTQAIGHLFRLSVYDYVQAFLLNVSGAADQVLEFAPALVGLRFDYYGSGPGVE
jgi:hypothetical protein